MRQAQDKGLGKQRPPRDSMDSGWRGRRQSSWEAQTVAVTVVQWERMMTDPRVWEQR